ncbi:hypothetical protein FISHEDRAFT_16695, partial [Fistulina hepatica ATCC 64428]
ALRSGAPIPGLYFFPEVLVSPEMAHDVFHFCMQTYFNSSGVNQVMLFDRAPSFTPSGSSMPPILVALLQSLAPLLVGVMPADTHNLLFPHTPERARQAIINMYSPGEGISPHVDLLNRFGDGIVGVSLGSGTVMRFAKVDRLDEPESWDVYLPSRSVFVLSGDARFRWTHEIERRTSDFVCAEDMSAGGMWLQRGVRISVTFRWLLPGAEII